jgi:hypothetical protein
MKHIFSTGFIAPSLRATALAGMLASSALLGGCYVVPLQSGYPTAGGSQVLAAPAPLPMPAPQPVTFSARLYPANEAAAAYGMSSAVVTNDLQGRGTFALNLLGESYSGEATRSAGSSAREGIANGSGNRGGYISCRYQMNSPTLGSGQCRHSSGALFTMHVGV